MEEALQIQRESETIKLTGWTFDQYDKQPASRVARMLLYFSMKADVERQKADAESRSSKGGMTGGR